MAIMLQIWVIKFAKTLKLHSLHKNRVIKSSKILTIDRIMNQIHPIKIYNFNMSSANTHYPTQSFGTIILPYFCYS